jgi:lysophospholipase L1-like esterase
MMQKIMILTDSLGNPRSFPSWEVFQVEETWPYLLKETFKQDVFWQLTLGDMTTAVLVNQPVAYLSHWKPDIIIVQSGINDCVPGTFAPDKFRATIKKFKLVFAHSRIWWVEICSSARYNQQNPGIEGRIAENNRIIREIYAKDYIDISQRVVEVNGFNAADHIHWNKKAHQALADVLIGKLDGTT